MIYKNPFVRMNFKHVTKLLQNLQTNQPFCEYKHFLSDSIALHWNKNSAVEDVDEGSRFW